MRKSRQILDASELAWDATYDVVVVGSGAAGLPAALNATRLGSRAVILEKAPEAGGSMLRSAAAYWIPNNSQMRADGKHDDRQAFLRYFARLARPAEYESSADQYGLTAWEYERASAFYDHAALASDTLAEMGAIRPLYAPTIPDYHATLSEATMPYGRTLRVDRGDGKPGKGPVMTAQLLAACDRLSIPILYDHRVDALALDDDGAVVGVRASHDGVGKYFRARQAVIFASGGFTHNRELRREFLPSAIVGGCAAPTNEGDFVALATELGVPLRDMSRAWLAPVPFEIALQGSPYLSGMFAVPGDSMIWVDKHGRRVINEKTVYNELASAFLVYDPSKLDYPRRLLFMIWDHRTARLFRAVPENPPTTPSRLALDNFGNVIYDDFHLIKGDTFDELCAAIATRLERLAPHTAGFALDSAFQLNLATTIARFNEFAARGEDDDFHRGRPDPAQLGFNGPARRGNDRNPTMHPISDRGPYFATIVCAGTIDTKGGPITNPHGQVLDAGGEPIAGLYAVGNCVASATGQAYAAGGATLGPIFTFAHLAAEHAAHQPRR